MTNLPKIDLLCGDSLLILPTLPADSFDSCVTDPPYNLTNRVVDEVRCSGCGWVPGGSFGNGKVGEKCSRCGSELTRTRAYRGGGFMGKEWDSTGIAFNVDLWREVLRVLKPGAHLLAFGGSRTYHRMACAIEDAGFEIRDSLHWLYGQGFPKSLDVSKAIDRERVEDRPAIEAVAAFLRDALAASPLTQREFEITAGLGFNSACNFNQPNRKSFAVPSWQRWSDFKRILAFGDEMDAEVWRLNGRKGKPGDAWYEREVTGRHDSHAFAEWETNCGNERDDAPKERRDNPATPAAQRWQGWGTSLKPSHEPIVLARKPLSEPTIAANILKWGVGGLNVDGCRVAGDKGARTNVPFGAWREMEGREDRQRPAQTYDPTQGRWPPNTLFSHLPECGDSCADGCAVAELGRQSGVSVSKAGMRGIMQRLDVCSPDTVRPKPGTNTLRGHNDTGTAARFFPCFRYEAKASRKDRGEGNTHPTVKPTALMQWLVRLVTPPEGVVLDPFAGSGTTLVACQREGFDCVGVEMEQGHCEIARGRLA